ncbi:J domain-containing protein [Commensalibacter communis]|uniref:J domain-containing protein n=1 Tax=Commensalibacter communis TaxID=2972786 RepID=UPI0022FFA1D6|nr:J domain-containing protein [Commensalibacter communis]CAI3957876.1 DnaJ-class molecular chaperone with C-terminal Zn finger domain (DnaJ) (PDB:1BQ0) [Commensalibacter communis]CAI3958556.1 DnaJ-class molecular chaperone with C-terminal Zn finger domain (DnaJ) (PDB:1BQ0) [Commensalibacter communis]
MTAHKKRFRAFDPDPDCPNNKCCDMPSCDQPAGYKAPKSRQQLNDYYWFCLEHIREYNKNWDYCKGMTPAQIENHLRASTVWDKPSWKLGQLGKADLLKEQYFKDSLGVFKDHPGFNNTRTSPQVPKAPKELQHSLKTLELTWPISLQDLRKRYTVLARKYHPDTNHKDKSLTEQFKNINAAYSQLRTHLMNSVEI